MKKTLDEQLVEAFSTLPGHQRPAAANLGHLKPSRRQALMLVKVCKHGRTRVDLLPKLKPGNLIAQVRRAYHHPEEFAAKNPEGLVKRTGWVRKVVDKAGR